MGFWKELLRLLNKLLGRLSKWERKQEQQEAQERRDAIDKDSAQYVADKYGDGRVREYKRDADETSRSE